VTRQSLTVRVRQVAPSLGDVGANRKRLEDGADASVDLVVFPELSLTGYSLGNRSQGVARSLSEGLPLSLESDGPAVAYGLVERGEDHLVYNAGVVQRGSRLLLRHRKVYLPTYGMYEEGRHFAPGRSGPRVVELIPGWRVGLLVCEELWHPSMAYLAALQGADLLLVLAAPGGRGDPADDDLVEGATAFGSNAPWELLARTTAFVHGIYLVLANRVGVEHGVAFSGGSLIVDPSGKVVARASEEAEDTLEATLDRTRLREARHPFSHLRDEDPGLLHRELERLMIGGSPPEEPER
jgi:predicted amidohydrolase